MATGWDDDDTLLAEMRGAMRSAGPIEESTLAAAKAAFTWRTVDAELAALSYDSRRDADALVRSGEDDAPTLVYEAATLSVELQLLEGVVLGQLVPAGPGEVTLLSAQGELAHTATDDLGCFSLDVPERGPVRLRCTTGATSLLTDWIPR